MKNKKLRFLIAAGPTREPLDPVRYLSNYSTGTMGRYLAEAARKKGHAVDWVRCPEDAETARDLEKILKTRVPRSDVFIMAAAVCDVRPAEVSKGKIKKDCLTALKFRKNPDILAALGRRKKKNQVFVGFALESAAVTANAEKKLIQKHLDLILAQRVGRRIKPFGEGIVHGFAIDREGVLKRFGGAGKRAVAGYLVRQAGKILSRQN